MGSDICKTSGLGQTSPAEPVKHKKMGYMSGRHMAIRKRNALYIYIYKAKGITEEEETSVSYLQDHKSITALASLKMLHM